MPTPRVRRAANSSLSMAMGVAICLAIACGAAAAGEHAGFYRRFSRADHAALLAEIATTRGQHAAATRNGDDRARLALAADLGRLLTIDRREREALALLAPATRDARAFGDAGLLGWLLLELATTRQYLRADAGVLADFSEALRLARATGDRELQHYVLHHRARYLVERGACDLAIGDFQQALAIREALGDAAAVRSTRDALAGVCKLAACQAPAAGPILSPSTSGGGACSG